MKIHYLQCKAIVSALDAIFFEKRKADRVIEFVLKQNKNFGSTDRAFFAETIYEITRFYRLYNESIEQRNNHWHVLFAYFLSQKKEVRTFSECADFNHTYFEKTVKKNSNMIAIRESINDELYAYGRSELGEKFDEELASMNMKASIFLRVNTLKSNEQNVIDQLQREHRLYERTFENCIELKEHWHIAQHELYSSGCVELQDAGSQKIALLLKPEAGMRVIDACAGGGGKSLHLAALMQNKGKIISMDIADFKLQNLRKRATRANIQIIETRLIENNKTIKRLEKSADRLLLDVPCSGIGVLKRNPDAKYRLTTHFMNELKKTQQDILKNYSTMLKPDGRMVYATCSIFPSENEIQIEQFLADNLDFELIKEETFYPSEHRHDGFYMALLYRKK